MGAQKLINMIKNRLGRQPQGRRVTNESFELELQRFGREPLQSNAEPSRPSDQLNQGTGNIHIRNKELQNKFNSANQSFFHA